MESRTYPLQLLVEHLNSGKDGLGPGSLTQDLELSSLQDGSSLDSSSDDGSSSGDGEDVCAREGDEGAESA